MDAVRLNAWVSHCGLIHYHCGDTEKAITPGALVEAANGICIKKKLNQMGVGSEWPRILSR